MVTMSEIMNSAKESIAALKKEEGVIPEKVAIHLEFKPDVLDYDLGDLYICGTDFYADDPEFCADVYLYLSQYSNVKSKKEKLRARRSRR